MATGLKSGAAVLRQCGAALLAQTVLIVGTPSVGKQLMLRYIRSFEKSVGSEAWVLA